MNKRAAQRLSQLASALSEAFEGSKIPSLVSSEVDFAMPTLHKIANSNADLDKAKASMKLIAAGKGTHTPLYYLGLKPVPSKGKVWMANIRVANTEIDVPAYLAELTAVVEGEATSVEPTNTQTEGSNPPRHVVEPSQSSKKPWKVVDTQSLNSTAYYSFSSRKKADEFCELFNAENEKRRLSAALLDGQQPPATNFDLALEIFDEMIKTSK